MAIKTQEVKRRNTEERRIEGELREHDLGIHLRVGLLVVTVYAEQHYYVM